MKTKVWVRQDLLLKLRESAETDNVGIGAGRLTRTILTHCARSGRSARRTIPCSAMGHIAGFATEPESASVGFIRMNGPAGKIVCTEAVNDHVVREANKQRGCTDLDAPVPFDRWWSMANWLYTTVFVDPDGREL